MRICFLVFLFLILSGSSHAQFIKEKSIDISAGVGISTPYDDIDITGYGIYVQGEYALKVASWFELRPYAGFILARSDDDPDNQNESTLVSDVNAFLIGGKVRVTAPIPWVAPYIEAGLGVSIGSIETITPFTNIKKSGFIYHIPFSLGLELGPKRNFDLALTYYFHPSAEQFSGAVAFGFSFPIKN